MHTGCGGGHGGTSSLGCSAVGAALGVKGWTAGTPSSAAPGDHFSLHWGPDLQRAGGGPAVATDEGAGGGSGTWISSCDVEMLLQDSSSDEAVPMLQKRKGEELGNLNTFPDLNVKCGDWGSLVSAESLRQTKGQLAGWLATWRHQGSIPALGTEASGLARTPGPGPTSPGACSFYQRP